MTSRIFKILTILGVTALIAGCKLVIVSPPGGDVTSVSSGSCAGGSVCEVEITNPAFTDTFTAVPKPGYAFVRWQGGSNDFNCGNSTSTTCTITFAGDAIAAAAVATFEIINIMPIYKDVGFDTDGDGQFDRVDTDDDNDGVLDVDDNCPLVGPNLNGFGCPSNPITETVTAPDGLIYAQPGIFASVTYAELAAACPSGMCTGTLSGYDVSGWKWATPQQVNNLMASITGSNCGYPCNQQFAGGISTTNPELFVRKMQTYGFTIEESPEQGAYLVGMTNAPVGISQAGVGFRCIAPFFDPYPCNTGLSQVLVMQTMFAGAAPSNIPSGNFAAWIYRE